MDKWFRVERFVEGGLEANCYTINFEDFSIVIDPCVSLQSIKRQARHLKEIKGIFITHGHFDHFLELKSYIDGTNAIIYLHKNAIEKLKSPVKNCSKLCGYDLSFDLNLISDRVRTVNSDFEIEGNLIKCQEWPGHTNCCISFMYEDFMFTGDFIFKGSIGRTDLYTGNDVMMKLSLEKFKNLKYDDIPIMPGHGKSSGFLYELKNNPYLLKN